MKVVGQGAFWKVFQVKKKGTSEIYATRVMRKDKIMEKNHAEYMKAERDILTKIDHPFVVQLRYSFQTKYRLYLVKAETVNYLTPALLLREDLARIYAAEIVSAVSHLHANGIMHRDLKPENILVDVDGHAMLTDFGLAKQFKEDTRSNSMCGRVEYMSPEIILGKGHDKAADWWSVGILLFEMLTGKDVIMSKIASVSQPEDGSSEPPEIDYSQIYLEEVGVKKTRIYGLGSQAPFYGHVGASSSSISPLQDIDFNARVNECVGNRLQEIKEEMKHEMKSRIREEIRQEMREELREEMRHELQQEVREQVDQLLQNRLSVLIGGLPTPPSRRHDSSSNDTI